MAKPPVVMAAVLLGLAVMTGVVKAWEPEPNPGAGPAERFTFGLWGDMPYAKNGDGPKIPALIADMNADRNLAFTAFDGDTKDGSSPCTDDQYTAAVDRFNRFEAPTVYVPGDNEWTDCHRLNNGGYNNLERLDHVRKVMFAGRSSFGLHTMPLCTRASRGRRTRRTPGGSSATPSSSGSTCPAATTTGSTTRPGRSAPTRAPAHRPTARPTTTNTAPAPTPTSTGSTRPSARPGPAPPGPS